MRANIVHVKTKTCSEQKGESRSVVIGISNEHRLTLIETQGQQRQRNRKNYR